MRKGVIDPGQRTGPEPHGLIFASGGQHRPIRSEHRAPNFIFVPAKHVLLFQGACIPQTDRGTGSLRRGLPSRASKIVTSEPAPATANSSPSGESAIARPVNAKSFSFLPVR